MAKDSKQKPEIAGYRTVADQVTQRLREMILAGELQAGQRLYLDALAKQLGVSMMPVREAIRTLTDEGLLIVQPYRGARVISQARNDIADLFEVRAMLEVHALLAAMARIGAGELSELKVLMRRMEMEKDPHEWRKLNGDFHAVLYRAAGKPMLEKLIGQVRNSTQPFVQHDLVARQRSARANKEHKGIVRAVAAGDRKSAAEALRAHIHGTRDQLLVSFDAAALHDRPLTYGRKRRGTDA